MHRNCFLRYIVRLKKIEHNVEMQKTSTVVYSVLHSYQVTTCNIVHDSFIH